MREKDYHLLEQLNSEICEIRLKQMHFTSRQLKIPRLRSG